MILRIKWEEFFGIIRGKSEWISASPDEQRGPANLVLANGDA
jgi:hypothetical protein